MIRLVWDFKGDEAEKMAEHHEKHLSEFASKRDLKYETGCERKEEGHHTAWIAVEEERMVEVRDALKPHRGELHKG